MKRTIKFLGILIGILGAVLLAGLFYYFAVTANISLDPQKLAIETQYLHVLDQGGVELETASRAADTPYSAFPEYLPNAFVAVEDKHFYAHNGFDYKRIVKAAAKNAMTFSFREGASTISQQLIKNTHLSGEKTVKRKLKEFKLTRKLEKNYSKEEILELYLNSIYFGHSAFGIGNASAFYFGKSPDALTPAESALLAALVKSPNRYSPFKDAEKCLARRNFVLSLMHEQDFLSDTEYRKAMSEPLPESPAAAQSGNAYLPLVYDEISEIIPDAETAELGDLRIFTAFDPALQAKIESFEAESDIALVVRGAQNNAIKAYHSTVGNVKRLPASTIKPLLVYGPAIEENMICPATPILDERTDFGGYSPDDAGGASGQYISVRYALSRSVNIPAVKILNTIGIERAAKYLEKMNLGVPKDDFSLALALGGMKQGYTLPALADGYATFAKGGTFAESGTILRIENGKGKVIFERESKETRVFSEETSFLVNDMLTTAAKEGTAKKLKNLPFPVCAKTGTGEGKGGNLDAYTIAYTQEDVVAVWMGNKDNSPINATGGGLPANYTKEILETLYKSHTPSRFAPPQGIVRETYDAEEYEKNHKLVLSDPLGPTLNDPAEYFKADALPKERSTKYSAPTIQKPEIYVKNGTVTIVLCHAEYYDYIVKRKNRGVETTIYNGKYCPTICDNSVKRGESYLYTVIPLYKGNEGTPVALPRVQIDSIAPPDDWWD